MGEGKTLATLAVAAFALTAEAQWITQRIPLKAGWNAVHLKVAPADTSCAAVFSDAAVTEVSWWNRDRLDDGTGSSITDFCNWYRESAEPNTFGRVIGDQRYLVYSTRAFNLDVIGTPILPQGTIYLGEPNLVGLNVPNLAGASSPNFNDYFRDCKAIWNGSQPWYDVVFDSEPAYIRSTVQITNASAAVWFSTYGSGTKTFTGPFNVSLDKSAPTVAWTTSTDARTITVRNESSEDRVLCIGRISSLPPPTGHGTCAGDVELSLESIDWTDGYAKRVYTPMNFDDPFTTNIAAGASFEFRVKPDLSRMPATGDETRNYMSVLEISDKGSTVGGEVRAQGTCLYRVGVSASGTLAANTVSSAAGLWIGTVVLGEVSRARTYSGIDPAAWDHEEPITAPHPFQFRLIVHVDAMRNVKILKEVFSAKKNVESDTYLLTDRATAIAFRGLYPDGTIKRTSSANFPFMAPLALTGGEFMAPDATLTATLVQRYDDKTNPFVHSFHPQHDNIAFSNQRPSKMESGDEGYGEYESWGVTRDISLTFEATDSAGAASSDSWNRTVTGGIYEEKVYGLIGPEKPIVTRGVFRLAKVNDTAALTTEVIP